MSEGMEYHADGNDLTACQAQMETEIAFLKGTPKAPLYNDPCAASEAAGKLKAFTEAWPDPFTPGYGFANPWANKKENKGKKERPAGPVRPSPSKEVAA